MKTACSPLSLAVAAIAAVALALTVAAQAPQAEPSTASSGASQSTSMYRERHFPPPTNLQVLPRDLTGEQVRQIMRGWAAGLGVDCDTCHAPNPNATVQPGHRARLDFALDIKPQKNTARLMYKMVQDINTNYIALVKNDPGNPSEKVSCGTCHRGHLTPPPFTSPERHEGPRPQSAHGASSAPGL